MLLLWELIMMPSCPYFILSTPLPLNMRTYLSLSASAWGQARLSWYVHFASCFYIDIYCIMGCYYTLCHNTYGYSLLFYKVYIRRENAGSWNSGLENEQILETYSAQLQKSWNSTEHLKINKEKSLPKMKARGPTPCSRGWGAPPLGRAPYLVGPLDALRRQLQLYIFGFGEKKSERRIHRVLRYRAAKP